MGLTQVRPAERPVQEAMLFVPGVEGLVEGWVLHLGNIRRLEEEEEGGGGGGGGGVMVAGGGGAVSIARRRRRRGVSENPLGAKTSRAGATVPPQPASPDGRCRARFRPATSETMTTAASAGGPVRHV